MKHRIAAVWIASGWADLRPVGGGARSDADIETDRESGRAAILETAAKLRLDVVLRAPGRVCTGLTALLIDARYPDSRECDRDQARAAEVDDDKACRLPHGGGRRLDPSQLELRAQPREQSEPTEHAE